MKNSDANEQVFFGQFIKPTFREFRVIPLFRATKLIVISYITKEIVYETNRKKFIMNCNIPLLINYVTLRDPSTLSYFVLTIVV